MTDLIRIESGRYRVYLKSEKYDIERLIMGLKDTPVSVKKGRLGIKILYLDSIKIACRQYAHGGILRRFTGDMFFSAKRAIREMEILSYLASSGIPTVEPVCVIEEKNCFFKKLYLLTVFEEKTENLLEFLAHADKRTRLRMAKKVALLFWMLESVGIYHPDLHLDNILVGIDASRSNRNFVRQGAYLGQHDLLLIDFDRAERKIITARDIERMLWRLNRYTEKMERNGRLKLDADEKTLFLRTYERVTGRSVLESMRTELRRKQLLSRIGWVVESVFYRT